MVVVLIVGILALVFLIVLLVKYFTFKAYLIGAFKRKNTITEGKKGTGKDLVYNYIINQRKEPYYSNLPYTKKEKNYNNIQLYQLSHTPNTFTKLIDNDITLNEHTLFEGVDAYISDGGIYLPSSMDAYLWKKYPSLPIFYATSRHTYSMNIHINTQNIERVWKALREQADFFIHVEKTYKIFGFIFITQMLTYEKLSSALKVLEPMHSDLFNKTDKALIKQYNATNGKIKRGFIIQFKCNLHYDTRAFEKILLKGERLEYNK